MRTFSRLCMILVLSALCCGLLSVHAFAVQPGIPDGTAPSEPVSSLPLSEDTQSAPQAPADEEETTSQSPQPAPNLSPSDQTLTRGAFIQQLYQADLDRNGLSVSFVSEVQDPATRQIHFSPNRTYFADVAQSSPYHYSSCWAMAYSITSGQLDALFRPMCYPNRTITRQEAAVMLYHYAAYLGCGLSGGASLSAWDAGQVSSWARTAMAWCLNSGILAQDGDGNLNPTLPLTSQDASHAIQSVNALASDSSASRGAFLLALYRQYLSEGGSNIYLLYSQDWAQHGLPGAPGVSAIFQDVTRLNMYYDAVYWATASLGLSGTQEHIFSVSRPITREQAAVILWKYAQLKGTARPGQTVPKDFVSSWAARAVSWSLDAGVFTLSSDGFFHPDAPVSLSALSSLMKKIS